MPFGNAIYVAGNLARDIELKRSSKGTAYARGALAVSHGKDKDASFIDFTIFGELAENAAESFTKGNRVLIEGRIQQDKWETDSGEKRSKVGIVVDDIAASVRWAPVTVHKTEKWSGPAEEEDLF
jgi:single-strand DNA-binding protein